MKKQEYPKFVILWDEYEYDGPDSQPFNDGPYSGFSDTRKEVQNFRLFRSVSYYPEINIPHSDRVFFEESKVVASEGPFVIVVNLYEDGGTFGSTSGLVDVRGVFLATDTVGIEDCVKKAKDEDYGYFGKLESTEQIYAAQAPWLEPRLK